MPKWLGLGLFVAMALLFLVANRGAYEGYFSADDLDNISWTRALPASGFISGLLAPRHFEHNFRPVGHFFYHAMEQAAGLDFRWYVAAIHALHLVNVWLVWLFLRRLNLAPTAAAAGTALFAFHMGVFDVYWKPMYVFDLLCALFSLLCLLAYTRRRFILSFICFWLAYKSKEMAVMLPAALACYEFWFGERRWRRLVPFFAVSLSFGLQGLLMNPRAGVAYRFSAAPAGLWSTTSFYASRILLVPYAGFALLALPWAVRDRRVYLGLAAAALLLAPVLLLPGRLYGAYLYVPLAGLCLAAGALAERCHVALLVLFFAAWLPWNHWHLRANRRATLAAAYENHAYVSAVFDAARTLPATRRFVYDGAPPGLPRWGVEGALRYFYREHIEAYPIEEKEKVTGPAPVALLAWDPIARKMLSVTGTPDAPRASYITMAADTPVWQLGQGWYGRSGSFRWTKPVATARLLRPAGARVFELVVNAGPLYIQLVGRGQVEVSLDGRVIGRAEFTRSAWHTTRWDLPDAPPGPVEVGFRAHPELRVSPADKNVLGVAIGAFGFR